MNTFPAAGSVPGPYYTVGDRVVFRANDVIHGSEWWVTDGTEDGTELLADIFPGPDGSSPRPSYGSQVRAAAVLGGTLFFAADDGVSGTELWKTDSTPQGTVRVRDIAPGPTSSRPDLFSVMGDTLYFAADDRAHGIELWKSDGTEDGTVMVADVLPGAFSSQAVPLAPAGGRMLFAATTLAGIPFPVQAELWATDGTAAGTVLLKDINPNGGSNPGFVPMAGAPPPTWYSDFGRAGDVLYFAADDGVHGREVWKSDGTPEGTTLAADATPGAAFSLPHRIIATSDGVYFVSGLSLFRVADNTPVPTLVTRLNSEPVLAVLNDTLYVGGSVTGGAGLFKLDRATNRLVSLRSPVPFAAEPFETWLVPVGGRSYFVTPSGLWTTDGTPEGTRQVPMPSSPRPGIAAAGGAVYFGVGGQAVWRSDGTADGTRQLRQINTATASSSPGTITWLPNGRGLFGADRVGGDVRVVWVTDGTPAGTFRFDGPEFPGGIKLPAAQYAPITQVGPALDGRAYFWAETDAAGIELWSSDGTAEGTRIVKDINPGPAGASHPNFGLGLTPFAGRLYFLADDGTNILKLWSTDGTDAGTRLVTSASPAPAFFSPDRLTVAGNFLYFFNFAAPEVRELWRTDGTAEGTVPVRQFSAPFGSGLYDATAFRGQLYFSIETAQDGIRVWRSDGTAQGTAPLIPPAGPFPFGFQADELTVAGDNLFFRAGAGDDPIWFTDGTDAGTRPLAEAVPGLKVEAPSALAALGDSVLIFNWGYRAPTAELWKTDGTPHGTELLKAFAARPDGDAAPAVLKISGGRMYFRVTTADAGSELWSTDGTPAGTVQVQDLWPGPGGSHPDSISVHDGRLFFAADDGPHGSELWSAPLEARVVGRHVFYNHSTFDGTDAGANPADDGAVAADKAALLPGQPRSFSNVTSYTRGINGVMIDVFDLPAGAGLGVDDFDFGAALRPSSVTVRRGAGAGGSDRVTLVWTDYSPGAETATMAVANGWLTVTMKATPRTGLIAPDVFSFGNLVGEVGNGGGTLLVNTLDLLAVRRRFFSASPITGRFDFDRDGRVNATDFSAARANYLRRLSLPPAAPAPAPRGAATTTTRVAAELLA